MRNRWFAGWVWLLVLAGCSGSSAPAEISAERAAPPTIDWTAYLKAAAAAERIDDRVQRCMAYPDLPGNVWPPGAAKARCALLQSPAPTLDELNAILGQRVTAASVLERVYAQRLAAHHDDPRQREAIFLAYLAFGSAQGEQVAQQWLALAPDSAFAQAAVGRALASRASEIRGDRYVRNTSEENLRSMQRIAGQAVDHLRAALRSEPRLSSACTDLSRLARMLGADQLRDQTLQHCLKVDPLSWNVRFEALMAADPRWRSSPPEQDPFAAMDVQVRDIEPLVSRNPALGSLIARAIGMRAYLATLGDIPQSQQEQRFLQAAHTAPDPMFIAAVGDIAEERKDHAAALAYYSQALRLAPEDAHALGMRARVRRTLGDYAGSMADARAAIDLNDRIGSYHRILAMALRDLGRIDEAREAFSAAMQFPKQRRDAFFDWCDTMIRPTLLLEQALSCTEGFVSEYPDYPDALFQRSWTLHKVGDPTAREVEDRFRAVADRSDRRQRQMLDNLHRLTGR